MRTKAQLIEEILSIKAVDTKSNLMKKSLAQLESLLNELEDELVSEEHQSNKEPYEESQASTQATEVERQVMIEQLKKEMLAELKEQVRKEIEDEQQAKSSSDVENSSVVKRREIDRNEMIPIMNVTNGTLVYLSKKTGTELHFTEYGDVEYIDYQELLTMKSGQRRFFDEPFILVMDDDVVNALGLTKMYENMKNPDQIDKIFDMSQREFEDIVEKSPKGIKFLIISRAKKLYESGELDSIRKINYLNQQYQAEIGKRG